MEPSTSKALVIAIEVEAAVAAQLKGVAMRVDDPIQEPLAPFLEQLPNKAER